MRLGICRVNATVNVIEQYMLRSIEYNNSTRAIVGEVRKCSRRPPRALSILLCMSRDLLGPRLYEYYCK